MFGAVAQVLLLLQDELGQRQAVGHLHRPLLVPLEDEVVHGVADCGETEREAGGHNRSRHRFHPFISFLPLSSDVTLLFHSEDNDVRGQPPPPAGCLESKGWKKICYLASAVRRVEGYQSISRFGGIQQ